MSEIELPDAPPIPGLKFRQFDPSADYPPLCEMLNVLQREQEDDEFWTPKLFKSFDDADPKFDPRRHRIIAQVDGRIIGTGRVRADKNLAGERVHIHSFNMLPQWRRKGIGRTVLHHNERRLREISATRPSDGPAFFETFLIPDSHAAGPLMQQEGYAPFRFFNVMSRPIGDDIPDVPIPPGIKIRPIEDGHLRAVFDSNREAFRDHWGFIENPEPDKQFNVWCTDPFLRKDLSRAAWDGDQVVGNVIIFLKPGPRNRAWTESIAVRRPWRKRGIASALIAQCLHALKAEGITEASLGVDTQNLSGALRLYQALGYEPVKRSTIFRKAFTP